MKPVELVKAVKGVCIRLTLVAASLLLALGLFEAVLSTGVMDGLEDPGPVWIPHKYRELNRAINESHRRRANRNWYEFNNEMDIITELNQLGIKVRPKPPGVKRIVVLGDSFVWGVGLKYEDIWTMKLKQKIAASHSNAQLISWGKEGWETIDQFKFISGFFEMLEGFGEPHGVDLAMVGFVPNDPSMGHFTSKILQWQHAGAWDPVKAVFRNSFDFIASHANAFAKKHFLKDYGYGVWDEKLFTKENLDLYGRLLRDFGDYMKLKGVRLLFVLTPTNADELHKKRHDAVIPLLEAAGIEYLDLYPRVYEKVHGVNPRTLWANPADGHPGPLLTDIFAEEVYRYLKSGGFFDAAPVGEAAPPKADKGREREKLRLLNELIKNRKWTVVKDF